MTANRIGAAFAERNSVYWAIIEQANSDFVGSGEFWRIATPRFWAEIGYELRQ